MGKFNAQVLKKIAKFYRMKVNTKFVPKKIQSTYFMKNEWNLRNP